MAAFAALRRRPRVERRAHIGAQFTIWCDGTMAANGAVGSRCASMHTLAMFDGRIMPSPGFMQGKSGGDMDTIYARLSQALAQKADIPGMGSQGHNDPLMSTDPDSDATLINKWIRNMKAWVDGNPRRQMGGLAYCVPICSTLPSTVGSETSTIWGKVWQRQRAAVEAIGDPAVFYVPTGEALQAATVSSCYEAGDTAHTNNLGGYTAGLALFTALDPWVMPASKAQILAMLTGNTYPGLTAANLDGNTPLTGTGGTKSGTVTPTGNVADTKTLTNNLTNGTSVAVAASVSGGIQSAAVSGTPAAENTVILSGAAVSVTGGTPGAYNVGAGRLVADDGSGGAPTTLNTIGADVGNGTYGLFMTTATVPNAGTFNAPFDHVVIIPPNALGAASTFTQATRWAIRPGASAGTPRMQVQAPTLRVASTRQRHQPAYWGDNGVVSASQLLRIAVTTSNAPTARITVDLASTANVSSLSGEQTIDGVLTSASRVLLKNQSTASQNGVWLTAAGAWSRPTDYDDQTDMQGKSIVVSSGSTQSGQLFLCTTTNFTGGIGTASLAFSRYSLRLDPGSWAPYGLTEADFAARRVAQGALVTGSISGSVLTVSAVTAGTIAVGQRVETRDGTSGLTITSLGTGAGGTGTYNLSGSATVSSQNIYCLSTVTTLTGSTWTFNPDPAVVAVGARLFAECDANNGVGSTVTARDTTSVASS